jgi:two-component system chemotaxis family response regulator WspR
LARTSLAKDADISQQVSALERKSAALEEANRNLRRGLRGLQRLVCIDPLTGLGNRRLFETSLASELRRAARTNHPLTLLICDIDDFKEYSASHGHVAGDIALTDIAHVLSSFCRRGGDLVMRFAGDAFALILPDVRYRAVTRLADNLLQAVRGLPITAPVRDSVTISIGGAVCEQCSACDPSSLINTADQALYYAKSGGRDRAVLVIHQP